MTLTIPEIQARLLEIAKEKREEQAVINRSNLHKELNQQYKGEDDPADFWEGLTEH
jgi:hypothetical protein